MDHKKIVLKNGLRILLIPMKDAQTATVLVMAGTGSRYETRENNGISHFLEHMFFKGTEKRPNTLAISEELDGVGGMYNAFTSKEYTGYWAKVGAKHAGTALDVISDIFLHAKLEAKEIEKERGTILQELNMYEDTPVRHVDDIFETLLYGDTPLGWEIIGTKENIRTMKRTAFQEYLRSHYRPNNVVVCVAGKFSQKDVLAKIKQDFESLDGAETPEYLSLKETQEKPAILLQEKKTDQTHMILGVRAYDMFHRDRYVLSVLSTILGGNMSSRLFIQVRERRGLAYSVHTFVEQYQDVGYLAAQCGVEHENLEKTIKVIVDEYKKISKKLVSAKELRKAKEYIKGKIEMGLESSDEVASYFAEQELLRKEVTSPDIVMKRIDRVTSTDVLRVAKDIFRKNSLNLAVIGPHNDMQKFEKLMRL